MEPLVAIVGRPNVGKSTLFNRLARTRAAIVQEQPGVTRDRLYLQTRWGRHSFNLVDTGGIQPYSRDRMEKNIKKQAEVAMEEADLVLMVVDARQGITGLDREIAQLLRKNRKPVILVANKAENPEQVQQAGEFFALGLGEPVPVSAIHGLNTGELLDLLVEKLPQGPREESVPGEGEGEEGEGDIIKVAVVGRPNAGKSSLVNYLLAEERMIVSEVPGTTRDAVDSILTRGEEKYLFIDTAGIRRKSKVSAPVEYYSVLRAFRAMERAQVVIILVDALEKVTDQDKRIAGKALEMGKAMVLAVNKWDLVEKDDKTAGRYQEEMRRELAFLDYVPVIFISALTGQRLGKVLEIIRQVNESAQRRIPTGPLNSLVKEAVTVRPPPGTKGRSLKIYYATQVRDRPPTFLFFVNEPSLLHFSYRRYLENSLRRAYDFQGTPLKIITRKR